MSTGGAVFAVSPDTRRLRIGRDFPLDSGAALPELVVAFRTWGRLNARADNAVVVCHALTGTADADSWWAPLFGPARALDPERDFIVCANVLGGCYGSTGPTSVAPDGRRYGARFPRITVRDQVRAQIVLLNALGVRGIRLVIGGSMGGLQALEWALLDQRVAAVATIAASGRHSSWCIAWSEAQRQALAADPRFADGHYDPSDPPLAGLAAARAIAMLTYRTAGSLAARYGRASGGEVFGERARRPADHAVAGWLSHHGELLNARFDANSYLRLIDAMDSHDIGTGRGGFEAAAAQLCQPVLVVSIPGDALYVAADQQELAHALPCATLATLESRHGHDGFLLDADALEPLVRSFRERAGQTAPIRRSAAGRSA
jgi:homoserine O-acetyltransferase